MKIEDFEILKEISRGAFGDVFLCQRNDTPGELLALKAIGKNHLSRKNLLGEIVDEKNIMASTNNRFIVNLRYCLQSTNMIYFVMDYCCGGDLCNLLCAFGYMSKEMAVYYIIQVVLAVDYLHSRHIIHRDIKPENMLLDASGRLKLSDFGLSAFSEPPRKLNMVGTPGQVKSFREDLLFNVPFSETQTPAEVTRKSKIREGPIPIEFDEKDTDELEPFSSNSTLEQISISPQSSQTRPEREVFTQKDINVNETTPKAPKVTFDQQKTPISTLKNQTSFCATPEMNEFTPGSKRRSARLSSRSPLKTPRRKSRGNFGGFVQSKLLGTPDYMSPELIQQQRVCPRSDCWSIGICLFELMVGIPPFHDETEAAVFDNIVNRRIDWPEICPEEGDPLGPEAKNAISALLTVNPLRRPSTEEILRLDLFSSRYGTEDKNDVTQKILLDTPPHVPELLEPMDTGYFALKNMVRNFDIPL